MNAYMVLTTKKSGITLAVSVILLVGLLFVAACDSGNNGNNRPFCQLDEFIENVSNSECLAEELLVGCSNIDCSGRNPTTSSGNLASCSFVDCETLSCDNIVVNQSTDNVGLMAEISVEELTGLPIGLYILDDLENDFICGLTND